MAGMEPAHTTTRADVRRPSTARSEDRALFEHLLSCQLARILKLVDLEVSGCVALPDTFASRVAYDHTEPSEKPEKRLAYGEVLGYARSDPRFHIINRGLGRALRLGQFLCNGSPVSVDGFRLANLEQWSKYPVASLSDNCGAISSFCNCDCDFCFEKGTRGAGIALGRSQLNPREVETRIRYYSPEKNTGLVQSGRYSLEPFANPRCLEILEAVKRAAPVEQTNITTNGSCLTEEVVRRLARLSPVMVTMSMNAGSREMRKLSMRDHKPGGDETALAALALLREYEIPFIASYVPWPTKPLSDLEDMVRLVDANEGLIARVCMPSWTRFAWDEAPFDTETYWKEILQVIKRLRTEVSVPIHLMPNMYELRTMLPVVQGTFKHSPAAEAGIRYGDVILAIDDQRVLTRPEVAIMLARRFEDPGITETRLALARDGELVEVTIEHTHDLDRLRYPYKQLVDPSSPPVWRGSLGLHMSDGFELRSFARLKEILAEYKDKRVLLFISPLGEPYFAEGTTMLGGLETFEELCELHVATLRPSYWGGNVLIGDLWTFNDLTEQTRSWMEGTGLRPDAVIAPRSFLTNGGNDLLGDCYLDFERELGVEFRPLPCPRIAI